MSSFIISDARTTVKTPYKLSTAVHRLFGIINIKLSKSFTTDLFVLVHVGENVQLFMFLLDFSFSITSFIQ